MSAAVVNITLNRLIEEFFKVGAAHKMIKTTFYGDFLNIVSSNRVKYCSLLVNTADGNISKSYIEFRVEIAVMDKVFNDQSNLNDVESDTAQILQDLYSVIDYSNRWQSFAKITNASAPIRKFISKGQDVVTGWSMTLNIGVKRRNGICNIPIEDYDYQGNYAAYCAGVRIFQDNVLVEVVPSGGRFDYSAAVVPITITVNGDIFYADVTTDQEIPVKDEGGTARGSKVGINWVIADADQTLNDDPVVGQRPETIKAIKIQNLDAVDVPLNVLVNTATQLTAEVPNVQVNVNGDAFESGAPGSTVPVPVLDAADNPVGTNAGPKIVIASSLIDVNGAPLIPVRAEQAKSIILLDAVDNDPVTVIIATNTEALAEIIVPNGSVVNKDSAGATLYTTAVKSGGTVDRVINDGSVTLKNTQADMLATYTNKAQEAKVVTLPIIYLRPPGSYYNVSWETGDEYWIALNDPDPYVAPVIGIPAMLDPTNPHKLLHKNAFGHYWRRTGVNGGYYDIDTAQYKLVDGTVSNVATVFGTGADGYFIDHMTGLGWKSTANTAQTFTNQVATIQAQTCAGFTDFQLCSFNQFLSLWIKKVNNFLFTDTDYAPLVVNQTQRSCTPVPSLVGASHRGYFGGNTQNAATGSALGCFSVRRHYI